MTKVYATFQQWSDQGWKIKKGQRHVGRLNDGTCLFEKGQCEYLGRDTFYEREQWEHYDPRFTQEVHEEPRAVYYADGSGYLPGSGPAGPLYFDRFGNT
jgi:hypothetical protein